MQNRFKKIYLNVTFFLFAGLFSLISIPVFAIYIVVLFPFSSKRVMLRRLRRLIRLWASIIISVLTKPCVQVNYKDLGEDLSTRGCIFISNHRSFSDGFLVAIPVENGEGIQVVSKWPFSIPVIGLIAGWANYLCIQKMPFDEFSSEACSLLDDGVSIVAFPEGTRSGSKVTGQFHGAMFRVALKAKCPIVPVCIVGNENIPPKGTFLLNPGVVTIHKLPAIKWEDYKDMSSFELKNKVREIIVDELENMDAEK